MTIDQLKKLLNKDDIVCAVYNNQTLLTSNLKGIRPWIKWLKECPELLENAIAVDKVIGKAAAMLMVVAKVKSVYTPIISEQAQEYLKTQSIHFEYDKTVPFISNVEKNGLCPMEKTIVDISDAYEGYQLLLEKIQHLMEAKKLKQASQ